MSNPGILLKFPLQHLNTMGFLSTEKISRGAFLFTRSMVFLFCFAFILMVMQYFYMDNDVINYVNNFEGVISVVQGVLKWCLCLYYKQKFLNLVNITKKFWNDDQCSTTARTDIQKTTKRILLLQKIFICSVIFLFLMATPYSIMQKELIVGDWQMAKNGLFKLAWIIIFLSIGVFSAFVSAYDCLYLSFCYELKMQCTIFSDNLEQLTVKTIDCESEFKKYYQKLQTYIEHHILLLKFHEELQNVYSVSLLVQYLTAAPLICAEMYVLTENSDTYTMIRYAVSTCWTIFQLAFYCVSADYVEHEMSTIGTAIYNSDWHSKHFPMLRTPIILMIQIAQQKKSLTACGLININVETFLNLLHLAISICVALKKFKILN